MDKTPIQRLQSGDVPGMVGWYEPRLLMRVGIRTMISAVFGQYADQRLIQAATDVAPIETIINRYNYSDVRSEDPERRVALGENGAYWVDYISDIGDGFEPTYTTAYLLAQPHLDIEGTGRLTAGSILVMGGDQCYPQATREEYKLRLQMPYDWAYDVAVPERKLFAIPGNHDWYDGLSAFDSLFCSARDRMSQQNGNKIGGWQCKQHRSYWALELPYRWWIWGCDIQFSQYLDISQVNYFEAIAGLMSRGDNLIICIAEPTWMIAEAQGFDEDSNFFKITSIARRRGIKICAVIAGDSHHYARYYAPGLDVHLFTAGGGGSFLHPTHTLKNEIAVTWPRAANDQPDGLETKFQPERGVTAERYDVRLKSETPGGATRDAAPIATPETMPAPASPSRRSAIRKRIEERRAKVYPSKSTSFFLSLKGLFFPFTNYFFGLGIGFIYWMVTWQFYTVAEQHKISNGQIDIVSPETFWGLIAYMPLYLIQALLVSISFVIMMGGLWILLCGYVDSVERPRWKHYLVKFLVGTTHFLAHVFIMFTLGLALVLFHNTITPSIKAQVDKIWLDRNQQPDIVRDVITETLEPHTRRSAEQRQIIEREDIAKRTGRSARYPSDRELPPLKPLLETMEPAEEGGGLPYREVRQLVGFVLYPLEMIFIGGFIGALLWGLYWVLAGCLLRMHTEDAFAALRIQDYRNFLRMKFEPDKVTIYPIGLDRVPKREHWMAPPKGKPPPVHNPQLVATRPIDIHLIEEPITIYSAAEDYPQDGPADGPPERPREAPPPLGPPTS
jgi:hypothetical protein